MRVLTHNSGESIVINGSSIYYQQAGNPSGVPILMLHGGFGTLEDFEPIVGRLLPDFRLIAMDARERGKSTLGDQPLTYSLMQQDAEQVLNHLHIRETILMGFSDGGIAAHRMAISNSERVSKLVSIGTPGG